MSKAIKILFLAANPKDTQQLGLDEEIRGVDVALRQAEFRDRFDIEQQWAVRVDDLQGFLLRYNPDIVHFSGHGSPASEIILEDNAGNSHPVSPRALSQVFSLLKDNIRCVVLNACYSEQQAQAIAQHIDCVVGMSKAIGDEAAITFAKAFYQALGFGRSVKTAFELGCAQIDLANLAEQDTPKLLASQCNPSEVVFVEPPQADETSHDGHMLTDSQAGGGIHAKTIEAEHVVVGVLLQGGEPQQAAALVSLAKAIRGSAIGAEEIRARYVVSGLDYIANPATASTEDLRKELAAFQTKLDRAIAAQELPGPDDAQDAKESLSAAETELAKPQPSGQRVLRKLDEVSTIVTKSAEIAQASGKIGAYVMQLAPVAAILWQVAQRLFGL